MRFFRQSTWGSLAIAWLCACGVMCPPVLHAADRDDNVIETFDVARHGDLLLLPVEIDGQQYRFLLDTADTRAWVDVTLRTHLEPMETSAKIHGKDYKVYRLAASLAAKSHLPINDDEAICADFSEDRAIYGQDIRGRLGMSFLQSHVVQIDFDAGKLVFLKSVPESAGSEFRITYDTWNLPRLNVEVNEGEPISFLVELGSLSGDISLRGFNVDEFIEQGRLSLKAPPIWHWVDASEKTDRRGWLDRFPLGEFRHEQVTVRENAHNRLGLSLLSRYIVTLDFPNNRLYLKKGQRFAEPPRSDLSGLMLTRAEEETRIDSVRRNTPAAASGLQAKDKILKVDGKAAASLSLFELRSLLMTPGARIQLDVTGYSGRRHVEMQLAGTMSAVPAPVPEAVSAEDDAAARDLRNVDFEGATSFDAEQIRKTLSLDIDFQAASHPTNPLPNYLKQLEEILLTGYRNSGFPKARAEAIFDAKQRRVIVRVQEGPRYRCADVRVTGLDDQETAALIAELTQEVPPPYVVPVVVTRDDGTTQTVWETATGKPVKLLKPFWKIGDPASFDKSLLADVGVRVSYWLWARGRGLADFHVEIKIENGSDAATLVIAVADPGVPLTIGEIKIEGAKINSTDDVLAFLEIRPGMPYDGRLQYQLERRLWESGRLISARISNTPPVRIKQGACANLTVVISEHSKSAPLSTPLAPYEQSLLKLRDWIVQWTEGFHDEELVIDVQCDSSICDEENTDEDTQQRPPAKTYELHVVTSPRNGQVISAEIRQESKPVFAQTFIARDLRAIFHSPLSATHLEFEHSKTTQLASTFELNASKPKSAKGLGTRLNFGMSLKSMTSGNATALSLKCRLDPLAVLLGGTFLADVEQKIEAGICTIRAAGIELQIDEKTGRLVQFEATSNELGTIRGRTTRGALQSEFDRQERLMAGSSNVFDANRPESSLAVYWIDEYRRFCQECLTSDHQQSLAALQQLCRKWSIAPVLELFSHFEGNDNSSEAFRLPLRQVEWAHPAMSIFDYDGAGTTAGYLLPLYQKLVPRTGWLWPLGRDGLFALMSRPVGTWDEIGQYAEIVESGPLGHLTSSLALAAFSPRISQKLASQAMKRLSAKWLKADYAALLSGDSWLGRNIVALAEALRQLDDSEIEALVRLLPDKKHHREIADSLLLLKAEPERPVHEVFPEAYAELWQNVVKRSAETALKTLASGGLAGTSLSLPDFKFEPLKADAKTKDTKTETKLPDFEFDVKPEDFKIDLRKDAFKTDSTTRSK